MLICISIIEIQIPIIDILEILPNGNYIVNLLKKKILKPLINSRIPIIGKPKN